jgi:hypothetical protein
MFRVLRTLPTSWFVFGEEYTKRLHEGQGLSSLSEVLNNAGVTSGRVDLLSAV